MTDSPRTFQSLNPTSQPFFPINQQRGPSSGDFKDRQTISSSPSSIAHTQSQSSDEELRTKSSLGVSSLASSTGFPSYASNPSPIQTKLFQDYSLTGFKSRESLKDGGMVSNRSSPPIGSQGFASNAFLSGLTTPNKDNEDNGTLSSVDSSDSRSLTGHHQQEDYQFTNPISAAFHPKDSTAHLGTSVLGSSNTAPGFGRLEMSRVSPSESRDTSGSADLAYEADQYRSSLHTLNGRGALSNNHGFGLPSTRPPAPSRSSSFAFDAFNGPNRTSSVVSLATVDEPTARNPPCPKHTNHPRSSRVIPPIKR